MASLGSLAAGFRFERVCLDIVGPLPVSDRGHKYILVAIDCFSIWAQAFPLTNMTAESVAEAFVLGWVAFFGALHSVHTDQGTQFTSALFKEVCRLLSISKSQTTSKESTEPSYSCFVFMSEEMSVTGIEPFHL